MYAFSFLFLFFFDYLVSERRVSRWKREAGEGKNEEHNIAAMF